MTVRVLSLKFLISRMYGNSIYSDLFLFLFSPTHLTQRYSHLLLLLDILNVLSTSENKGLKNIYIVYGPMFNSFLSDG